MMQARSYCKENSPLMVLIDLDLPENEGLALTHQIRNNPQTQFLPIIAFGENINHEVKDEALESGCDSLIKFPFVPQNFLDMIYNYLMLS